MARKINGEWHFNSAEVEQIFDAALTVDSDELSETEILKAASEANLPLDAIYSKIELLKTQEFTPIRLESRSRGAGGTSGGIGEFFLGLGMILVGGYLFTNLVQVRSGFFHQYNWFGSGPRLTPFGITLIPFCLGVGWLFYDARSKVAWLLAAGSVLTILVGILVTLEVRIYGANLYQLGLILVLLVGGVGLFLRSLKPH